MDPTPHTPHPWPPATKDPNPEPDLFGIVYSSKTVKVKYRTKLRLKDRQWYQFDTRQAWLMHPKP